MSPHGCIWSSQRGRQRPCSLRFQFWPCWDCCKALARRSWDTFTPCRGVLGLSRTSAVWQTLRGIISARPRCRYAVEQLTWLVTQLASSGNPAFLAQLQKNIELCDQKSGSNSSVPRDEDVKAFADIIDIAQVQLAACCAAPAMGGMQGRGQRHMRGGLFCHWQLH